MYITLIQSDIVILKNGLGLVQISLNPVKLIFFKTDEN